MKYYIDSIGGQDSNDGKSPEQAWKSLEKASGIVLMPGDMLLLRRGSSFYGQLSLRACGTPQSPCIVAPYGEGERPCIYGDGKVESTLLLYNAQGIELRGLEITNCGAERTARRIGILAQLNDFGEGCHLVIEDNYVHDVNGSNVKADGDWAGGIMIRADGNMIPSRYIDVLIKNNRIERCDRVGVYCVGMGRRDRWFPMLGVVIYGNELSDIGGDGILNIGTDGCRVERNRLLNGRMRDDMYCAGIWPWSADNTLICYNEVAGYRGVKDGQGFDCDFNCVGTIHRYNYSHDNEGGYILICTADKKYCMPQDIGNIGSRIERNLSVNDLCRSVHLAGPVTGAIIADNCIYVGKGIEIPCVLASGYGEPMGGPEETLFLRNIFAARGVFSYAKATKRIDDGTYEIDNNHAIPELRFSGNRYLGHHMNKPADDAPQAHDGVELDTLEKLLLDANGNAKYGLRVLDSYLDWMGWPKE